MRRLLTVAALAVACGEGGGGDQPASAGARGDGPPTAFVVNYPLEYFAGRIGGGLVQIEFPMAGADDPAFWQPTAEAIRAMQRADLILLNGAAYAKWVDRVTLPSAAVVNTSEAFADRYLTVVGSVTHTHGPEGEHSHEGTAFTTWLDPTLAIMHAEAVAAAFSERWPESASTFGANMMALREDLEQLGADLRVATAPFAGEPLVASHPVYQYLAAQYGLDVESMTWEPDEMPSERQWRALRDILARHPARLMLWEAEPMAEIADRLRTLGVEAVVFAPLGNRPTQGGYLDGMVANVERLQVSANP